jgi:repressor LexA
VSYARSAEIGRLVRRLRRRASITQETLARLIGCSKAQLSLMESGQRTISLRHAKAIEQALGVKDGQIVAALRWQSVPPDLRAQVEQSQTQAYALAAQLKRALNSSDPLSALRHIVEQTASNVDAPLPLRRQIPVINKVAAGYPTEFTDLDYPAAVADEYIACPDVSDPDAFAARVVGDSMEPAYREGDIVVFSPGLPTPAGSDCFIRLQRDSETTFKRVYFENDGRVIRLQPLNNQYPPRLVDRENVSFMCAAAYVMRPVGR